MSVAQLKITGIALAVKPLRESVSCTFTRPPTLCGPFPITMLSLCAQTDAKIAAAATSLIGRWKSQVRNEEGQVMTMSERRAQVDTGQVRQARVCEAPRSATTLAGARKEARRESAPETREHCDVGAQAQANAKGSAVMLGSAMVVTAGGESAATVAREGAGLKRRRKGGGDEVRTQIANGRGGEGGLGLGRAERGAATREDVSRVDGREKARRALAVALQKGALKSEGGAGEDREVEARMHICRDTAADVEAEVHRLSDGRAGGAAEYARKIKSLSFNLATNSELCRLVLAGEVPPHDVAGRSSAQLAVRLRARVHSSVHPKHMHMHI